jgi:hypothetical protein
MVARTEAEEDLTNQPVAELDARLAGDLRSIPLYDAVK